MGEFFTPIMVDVLVGGATVFVLDIEQFEKIFRKKDIVLFF